MIIKEREYKTCKECKSRELISDEEYGCDNCREKINLEVHEEYLSLTIHYHSPTKSSKTCHFCSWFCVFQKLKTLQTEYFISLPYLSFDNENPQMTVKAFWQAIKRVA